MVKTRVSSEKLIIEVPIKGIFVDVRKDSTIILIEDSVTKTFCRRIEKQRWKLFDPLHTFNCDWISFHKFNDWFC